MCSWLLFFLLVVSVSAFGFVVLFIAGVVMSCLIFGLFVLMLLTSVVVPVLMLYVYDVAVLVVVLLLKVLCSFLLFL